MKKRVCVMSWFLSIGTVILEFVPSIFIIFGIYYLVNIGNETPISTILKMAFFILIGASGIIILFYCGATLAWQWVVMDDDGIRARSLLVKYRTVRWNEVKKILVVSTAYNPMEPKSDFYCFVDNGEGKIFIKDGTSPYNKKETYIKIKASKKNKNFIEAHCPDVVFQPYTPRPTKLF